MEERKNLRQWSHEHRKFVSKKVKYTLLFFSYLFWFLGGLFAAVGGWIVSQTVGYAEISDFSIGPGCVLAALGCFIFIVSSIGVLGASRENICFLRTYKLCLLAILVFELCAGLVGFAFWPEIKKVVDSKISQAIRRYTDDDNLRYMIDQVQRKFGCCGSLTIDDWDSNPYFRCKIVGSYRSCGVPWSCCLQKHERNRHCGFRIRKKRSKIKMAKDIHIIGCLDKVFEYMRVNMFLIGALAVACNVPLLVGICLSHRMVKQLRKLIALFNDANEKFHWVENSRHAASPPFSADMDSTTY